VDGEYFRGMVKLWLFLNNKVSEADLYREFYPHKRCSRVDYRIFTGDVKTVSIRVDKIMEQKFFDHGFDRDDIKQYIEERDSSGYNNRVFYDEIEPVLDYLDSCLGVHPGRILNQFPFRYESGELTTVPREVYDRALRLKKKTGEALKSGLKFELEKLKEEIYGKRTGLTLFSAVEEELEFLKNNGGRRPKHYLGRSISLYKNSKLKRIASWRAQKIKNECHKLLRNKPGLLISSIPKPYLKTIVGNLLSALTTRMISMLMGDKSNKFESSILEPTSYYKEVYSQEEPKTSMDKTAHVLGMSKEAFDMMVARHRAIFRGVCIYKKKWYVPNLYLKEISKKEGFYVIKAKYEFLAKNSENAFRTVEKKGRRCNDSKKIPSQPVVSQGHRDMTKSEIHARRNDSFLLKSSSIEREGLSLTLYLSMPGSKQDLLYSI
jgi:hypothetical protein